MIKIQNIYRITVQLVLGLSQPNIHKKLINPVARKHSNLCPTVVPLDPITISTVRPPPRQLPLTILLPPSKMSPQPAFLPTPALLPRLQRPSLTRCTPTATVASSSSTTVTLDNTSPTSILRLTGADKPALLHSLVSAVASHGLSPTLINVADVTPSATASITLDSTVTDADIVALKDSIESLWTSAAPHAPPAAKDDTPVPFEILPMTKIPAAAVERGVFVNVDPYAHADWTTITLITPAGAGIAGRAIKAMSDLGNNIIFATVRSEVASDTGVAPDIYLIQTLAGKPLAENERVLLHNMLVEILME